MKKKNDGAMVIVDERKKKNAFFFFRLWGVGRTFLLFSNCVEDAGQCSSVASEEHAWVNKEGERARERAREKKEHRSTIDQTTRRARKKRDRNDFSSSGTALSRRSDTYLLGRRGCSCCGHGGRSSGSASRGRRRRRRRRKRRRKRSSRTLNGRKQSREEK